MQRFRLPEDLLIVVDNCVNMKFFEKPAFTTPAYDIIIVGRLAPEKNVSFGLSAIAALGKEHPVKVGIVGSGRLQSALEKQVEELHLGEQVQFLGWQPAARIVQILDSARAYYLPSLNEGSPLTAAEALLRGLPSVFNDIPVLREQYDGVPGTWFGSENHLESHVEALKHALEDGQRYDRRELLKRYSPQEHVTSLRRVYEEVLERPLKPKS